MIVFILVVGLIAFLLALGYLWQRHERKQMEDDPNYVEPIEVSEEDETI